MADKYKGSRTRDQRQRDYEYIQYETLLGTPRHIIAEVLGIPQQQVSLYMAEIRLNWKKQATKSDEDTMLGRELQTLDSLMKEAMQGWKDSRSKNSSGDVRFLQLGARIIELRMQLIGLIRLTRHEHREPLPKEISEHFCAALSEESFIEDDGVDFLN